MALFTFVHQRTEERAAGWIRLTREILKLPEAPSVTSKDKSDNGLPPKQTKEKASKTRRPQPLIKLVMRRFIIFLVSFFICSMPYSEHYS